MAQWNKDNPEKACKHAKTWSNKNYNRVRANQKRWKEENIERIRGPYAETQKRWREANRGKIRSYDSKRHAAELQRTPKWLSAAQLNEIKEIYMLAVELQWLSDPTDPLEVDHIVPLQGKNVSGLHVPWNLQILPRSANASKGNR